MLVYRPKSLKSRMKEDGQERSGNHRERVKILVSSFRCNICIVSTSTGESWPKKIKSLSDNLKLSQQKEARRGRGRENKGKRQRRLLFRCALAFPHSSRTYGQAKIDAEAAAAADTSGAAGKTDTGDDENDDEQAEGDLQDVIAEKTGPDTEGIAGRIVSSGMLDNPTKLTPSHKHSKP